MITTLDTPKGSHTGGLFACLHPRRTTLMINPHNSARQTAEATRFLHKAWCEVSTHQDRLRARQNVPCSPNGADLGDAILRALLVSAKTSISSSWDFAICGQFQKAYGTLERLAQSLIDLENPIPPLLKHVVSAQNLFFVLAQED